MEKEPREIDIEKVFAIALNMVEESEGWSQYTDDGTVRQEHKQYDFCPINAHRASGLTNASPDALADFYWNMKQEQWQSIDNTVTLNKLVENIDETTRVRLQNNALGWPIWPRQTLWKEKRFKLDDGYCFISVSTTHDSEPYDNTQFVRTTFHTGAFIFRREGDKTRITRVLHIDPNGSIPAMVVNNAVSVVTKVVHYFMDNVK